MVERDRPISPFPGRAAHQGCGVWGSPWSTQGSSRRGRPHPNRARQPCSVSSRSRGAKVQHSEAERAGGTPSRRTARDMEGPRYCSHGPGAPPSTPAGQPQLQAGQQLAAHGGGCTASLPDRPGRGSPPHVPAPPNAARSTQARLAAALAREKSYWSSDLISGTRKVLRSGPGPGGAASTMAAPGLLALGRAAATTAPGAVTRLALPVTPLRRSLPWRRVPGEPHPFVHTHIHAP